VVFEGVLQNQEITIQKNEILSLGLPDAVVARCRNPESSPWLPDVAYGERILTHHILEIAHGLFLGTVICYDHFLELIRAVSECIKTAPKVGDALIERDDHANHAGTFFLAAYEERIT
jgi:hypothetical protein